MSYFVAVVVGWCICWLVRQYSSHGSGGRWIAVVAVFSFCVVVIVSGVIAVDLANRYIKPVRVTITTTVVVYSTSSYAVVVTRSVTVVIVANSSSSSRVVGEVSP